eukprot:746899-Hanusia_phi.AAC.4
MDEIKMNLLGKNCLCPGFTTFICNLLVSSSSDVDDSSLEWQKEYIPGCGKEMYCTRLSRSFGGKLFCEVSSLLYRELKCILFAIEIKDCEGCTRVVLFPARYVIPPNSTPVVFLIADDAEDAEAVSSYGILDEEEEEEEEAGRADAVHYADEDSQMESTEEMVKKFRQQYHCRETKTSLEEVKRDSLEDMQDHVLICGSLTALNHFIATLRPKFLTEDSLLKIVILHPEEPPPLAWAEISFFRDVYFVQGSPLEPADLVRAGVFGVSKAIILSSSKMRSDEAESSYLVDADAIFIQQCIQRVRPDAQIVCELVNSSNISFLSEEERKHINSTVSVDPASSPLFASGKVYINSILDKLACQAFYNPNLVRILRALVVNAGTFASFPEPNVHPSQLALFPVPKEFHGKSYVQLFEFLVLRCMALPLGVHRKRPWKGSSPMPYVITNPDADMILQVEDAIYTLQSPEMDSRSIGFLEVLVIRARNLSRRQVDSSSGFVCQVEVGQVVQRTRLVASNSPYWNQRMSFAVHNGDEEQVTIKITDGKTGVELGIARLQLGEYVDLPGKGSKKLGSLNHMERWIGLERREGSLGKTAAVCLRLGFHESKMKTFYEQANSEEDALSPRGSERVEGGGREGGGSGGGGGGRGGVGGGGGQRGPPESWSWSHDLSEEDTNGQRTETRSLETSSSSMGSSDRQVKAEFVIFSNPQPLVEDRKEKQEEAIEHAEVASSSGLSSAVLFIKPGQKGVRRKKLKPSKDVLAMERDI